MPEVPLEMQDRSERHGKRLAEHWNERHDEKWPTQQGGISWVPESLSSTYPLTDYLFAVFLLITGKVGQGPRRFAHDTGILGFSFAN